MDRNEFERIAPELRLRIIRMVSRTVSNSDVCLAEDVAQDTLLRLWIMREKLGSYSSLEALAVIMARNIVIDAFRRSHERKVPIEDLDPGELTTPLDLLAAVEAEKTMDSILDSLPPAQRAILRMRHEEGMEIAAIAAAIGSSEGAVRVALSRARRHVMELFNRKINE